MKNIYILLSLCMFVSTQMMSQRDETVLGRGTVKLTGVWAGSTNTLSSFDENFELNNGGFVVFELNKDFLIGWTGYGSEFTTSNSQKAEISNSDLLLGYNFQSYKSLHPIAYLQMGGGTLEIENEDKDKVFVVQPSFGLEANIVRWFRIGLEGGYRFTTNVDTPNYNDQDLSSFFVGLKLKFGWSWGH